MDTTLGRSQRVRVEVRDSRLQESLGKHGFSQVMLYRSGREIVRDAFSEGLSEAGYLLAEDAPVVYSVALHDFTASFDPIPGKATSHVLMAVTIRRDGKSVASRSITGASEFSVFMTTAEDAMSRAAGLALTDAVERVIADTELARAIDPWRRVSPTAYGAARAPIRFGPMYRRRVAVVIGINRYQSWPDLEGAVSDARRVAEQLRKIGFDAVTEVYDSDARREDLLLTNGEGSYNPR